MKQFSIYLGVAASALVLFIFVPEIDLAASRLFYDAGGGFALVGFAFLLPAARIRRSAVAVAIGFGALVGLGRIAQGAHFLSDVVFAGLLVYGVTALLYWWIVQRDGLAAPPLARLGQSIL